VLTRDDLAVAAAASVDPDRWRALFDELMGRVAGRFVRVEPRRRARAFVLGLMAGLPRKNCWTIAEHAGDATPDGMQHLLERARWDADAVRDDVRGYVAGRLADSQAVLVVDETGDVKKGTATAGVQRQYTGTAGRVENAQVAVWLTYAGRRGHALIDRRLYLPRSWSGDPARRTAARIPEDVAFATKPALAAQMISAALDAGVSAAWVAGDEVYGADPGLRQELHDGRIGYVLAVAKDHHVVTGAGKARADALTVRLPRASWQRLSAGPGLKGHRWYDWAFVAIEPEGTGSHWLMIRRNRKTGELAWYRCWSPRHVPLADYARVAGRRWTTEENFQAGKGLAGLDEHQVRTWTAWHRWVTLAMLALAFLTIAAVTEHHQQDAPAGFIPLTRNEIARLAVSLTSPAAVLTVSQLRWSAWRRRHQHRSRACHYQRQSLDDP
jgi:SRSO17 transposase